jgi:siroheme synthase
VPIIKSYLKSCLVLPGIAASMYTGIPLTHCNYSSSVTFVTGHRRTDRESPDHSWDHLAQGVDTVVFYMGMTNLSYIQQQLMSHGRMADIPVALIRWGTMEKQEVLTGELGNIAQEAERVDFKSPVIIVVGEVVKLREKLAWFQKSSISKESQYLF